MRKPLPSDFEEFRVILLNLDLICDWFLPRLGEPIRWLSQDDFCQFDE